MNFLCDILNNPIVHQTIARTPLPPAITDNLKPGYGQRAYQEEAFRRFIYFWETEFEGKTRKPYHLLYNMATGSGKTVVMAGLILFLYEKGYRNFLFFVSSTNIIDKTRENFINSSAMKYLFNDKLIIDGKQVFIKEADTFEAADATSIHIKFTTTQLLHSDLIFRTKENSLTFEDFKGRKTVLIADEAHHLNSGTKKNDLFGSWEGTILEILRQHRDNILLEFTATLDHEQKDIVRKYEDKVIYKYDLAQFRADKYSKEISLVRSLYNEKERILQALILNVYRQELASAHGIRLKPVILFKAKKTIKESERNKTNFHTLIHDLSPRDLEGIRETSTVGIVQKAFTFFDQRQITTADLSERIKWYFREENCISANNDREAELNQLRLNTLEDENNPIRAVFAVQKLNEGWDVLNLFDIVRLYEGQNSGGSNTKPGATTLAEAQLIGRGARYFPFALTEAQDKFKRKYDEDLYNDLKVLEELYYHTKEDSRYISELKRALIDSGIYEDEQKTTLKYLELKPEFKTTDFYQKAFVASNKRVTRNSKSSLGLTDLNVARRNYRYQLASGAGKVTNAFQGDEGATLSNSQADKKLVDIPEHIIRSSLASNPFFHFNRLKKIFPDIRSMSEFIHGMRYLGSLEITFVGSKNFISEISHKDYLDSLHALLQEIEKEMRNQDPEYEASNYWLEPISRVFVNKYIKVPTGSERADGQEELILRISGYPYKSNFGTSEEKALVSRLPMMISVLQRIVTEIFLFRNERFVSITGKSGRSFEPDFILFCKHKTERIYYQTFIEAKGNHLLEHDRWKEDDLKAIRDTRVTLPLPQGMLIISAVSFYNEETENAFTQELIEDLTEKTNLAHPQLPMPEDQAS